MHLSTQCRFGEGPQQRARVQEVLQDSRAQTGREGERTDPIESHTRQGSATAYHRPTAGGYWAPSRANQTAEVEVPHRQSSGLAPEHEEPGEGAGGATLQRTVQVRCRQKAQGVAKAAGRSRKTGRFPVGWQVRRKTCKASLQRGCGTWRPTEGGRQPTP